MKNIQMKKECSELVIRIDLSKEYGKSKSGKTIIVASTEGNEKIEGGIVVGINAYKYPGASA